MILTEAKLKQLRSEVADERTFGPAWNMMRELGVIRDGHFWTNDQRHTPYYYDTTPLFLTGRILNLARDLPVAISMEVRQQTTVVMGPQFGGDTIGLLLSKLLEAEGELHSVQFIPIEKTFKLVGRELGCTVLDIRPAYHSYLAGAQVLLTDTVRSTDKTMMACAQLAERYGGKVLASVSLVDAATKPHPRLHFSIWKHREDLFYQPGPGCPQCSKGLPMTKF
ncbi:MAG: hypothetical protein KW802_04490 [Candidatus Doudnabacteria bacterium]|nr:hypothetical protein [Candidatus Doudnabacteria bacterium]